MLLAGEGSRLRPYTNDRPKCLVEVNGKSMLDRQLAVFKEHGIKDISFVTGYHAEMLADKGAKMYYNAEYQNSNMVYSLKQAIEELDADEVMISYGDILFTKEVLQKLFEASDAINVVADKQWLSYWEQRMEDVTADAESFKTKEDGSIAELGQPIQNVSEVEAQYIGLMKFKGEGVKVLKAALKAIDFTADSNKNMYLTDFLQDLIHKGHQIQPVYIERGWYEVDSVEDLKFVETNICLRV